MDDNAMIVTATVRGVSFEVDRLKVGGFRSMQWLTECQRGDFQHFMELVERVFGDSIEAVIAATEEEIGREPLPQEVLGLVLEAFQSIGESSASEPKN